MDLAARQPRAGQRLPARDQHPPAVGTGQEVAHRHRARPHPELPVRPRPLEPPLLRRRGEPHFGCRASRLGAGDAVAKQEQSVLFQVELTPLELQGFCAREPPQEAHHHQTSDIALAGHGNVVLLGEERRSQPHRRTSDLFKMVLAQET